ncbi:MAG: chorismate-binding protein [Thermoanaerobaculia bacterium]
MFHRDFAFIQTAPDRLFVGWGPFEHLPFRRPDRPAFFVADFFLDDPHPWRHPARWEEISVAEFAWRFPAAPHPAVVWQPLSIDSFAALFDSAQDAMRRGDFKKIVPVIFENGEFRGNGDVWQPLILRLQTLSPGLWAYGYSYQQHGLIGATPEMLFRSEGRGYQTMALAGTRLIERAGELLHDAKELREHRLVVDDIVRRLAPFGNVEVGSLDVFRMPRLAHLATSIRFEESGVERMSFAEMVRRLHPTAALGVSPRTEAGERWLREADRGVKRRTFGAPFGVERENRDALAVVSIRNLQWHRHEVRIGAGAGVLPESSVDREFDELRQKRDQVKELFGFTAVEAPAESLTR